MDKLAQLSQIKQALANEYLEKVAALEEAILKEAANTLVIAELHKLAEGNKETFESFVKQADANEEIYGKVLERALSDLPKEQTKSAGLVADFDMPEASDWAKVQAIIGGLGGGGLGAMVGAAEPGTGKQKALKALAGLLAGGGL